MELKPNQVRLMLIQVADAIIAAEPMLSQADRDLGDGDHGLGMARGMDDRTPMRAVAADHRAASLERRNQRHQRRARRDPGGQGI
jgi:hypothetical protein